MTWQSVRNRLVDSPDSVAAKFRRRRWDMLLAEFPDFEKMSVIDLGGRADTWLRSLVRPAHVHVINLEPAGDENPSWVSVAHGNACQLDDDLRGQTFDLVFSNAVLEHVGGHSNRIAFAESVHSLAPRHWIQTPYRYFPLEPHWLFPFFQHLPIAARTRISEHWRLGHTPPASHGEALAAVMEVELVSRVEMRSYFPDSRIRNERIGPLVKSLVAVRT